MTIIINMCIITVKSRKGVAGEFKINSFLGRQYGIRFFIPAQGLNSKTFADVFISIGQRSFLS